MNDNIKKSLPPNIAIHHTKSHIPCLQLSLTNISYLQTSTQTPQRITYKWWGSNQPQKYSYWLSQQPHKFYIAVSEPMFIRYCIDMKVLQFDLADSVGKGFAYGVVNFMLLKGWDGRLCYVKSDLKNKNNNKIGEVQIGIQIKEVQNVYLNGEQQGEGKMTDSREFRKGKGFNNQNAYQDNILEDKRTKPYIKRITDSEQQRNHSKKNNFIDFDYENEQQQYKKIPKRPKNPQNQNLSQKQQLYRRLNLPLPDPCICPSLQNRLSFQKLKLREQIQLFFSKPNLQTEFSSEQLNIEMLGWQPLQPPQPSPGHKNYAYSYKVRVPMIDKNGNLYKNQYTFQRNFATLKVTLEKVQSQEKIKMYLMNQVVEVQVGDSVGTVPMYKIVASKGEIITTGIYDKKNKKDILKGHFSLRMKPIQKQPQKIPSPQPPNIHDPKKQNPIHPKPSPQQSFPQPYGWSYIKQANFINSSHFANSNVYCQIKHGPSHQKTKTVWNTETPKFNEIITFPLPKDRKLLIEVWNRKQRDQLIGTAEIEVGDEEIRAGFKQMEVPIVDFYQRVQGYIGVCVGVGDLVAATQFVNTHARAIHQNINIPIQSERQKKKSQTFSQPQPSPHIISSQQSQDSQTSSQSDPNPSSHSSHPSPSPPPHPYPRPHPHRQDDFTLLQLHNIIFTGYAHKNYSWFGSYGNKEPSIAEMCSLLKPFCSQNNVAKFVSVYLSENNGNVVKIQEIQQSYQAFLVYYKILVSDRDRAINQTLAALNTDTLTITQLQHLLTKSPLTASKPSPTSSTNFWSQLKSYLDPQLVEKIRYFYSTLTAAQFCDLLRKFQVYQTTQGEVVDVGIVKRQVLVQITDVLEIDQHQRELKRVIKEAGLELSKFQLLCLFGEVQRKIEGNKMIKSPTFGYLTTDRPLPQEAPTHSHNPSLALNLDQSSISKNFGNPNISPIHNPQPRPNTNRPQLKTSFMDLPYPLESIEINGKFFSIDGDHSDGTDGTLFFNCEKKFSYKGYVRIQKIGKVEFQGIGGQWIGLVDGDGVYCGSLCFQ